MEPWLSWNWLYRPGGPQTHRDQPASASRVLGLKVCTPTLSLFSKLYFTYERKSVVLAFLNLKFAQRDDLFKAKYKLHCVSEPILFSP
jgi:hypothetical protein